VLFGEGGVPSGKEHTPERSQDGDDRPSLNDVAACWNRAAQGDQGCSQAREPEYSRALTCAREPRERRGSEETKLPRCMQGVKETEDWSVQESRRRL
jgi:hypothetical protein